LVFNAPNPALLLPELIAFREVCMPRFLLFLIFFALLHAPGRCKAGAFIEHLEPPVLAAGKVTRMTAIGSELDKALDVWTSLPVGKLKATPSGQRKAGSAVFDIKVAADAPVGLFGLRVATANGLSNIHLCMIDDLPVRPAPDSSKGPAKTTLPCALWGKFREAGVDRFAIHVKAGQRVSFEVVGNRLGKEVDPLITIRDERGRFVAEHDNDLGLYFDCRFEHQFAAAGTYTISLRDSRFQGHEHGFYVLRMGRFPAARVALPAVVHPAKQNKLYFPEQKESLDFALPAGTHSGTKSIPWRRPGDEGSSWIPVEVSDIAPVVAAPDAVTAKKATVAKVPAQLCGVLTKRGERQFFRIQLTKGQSIHAVAHGRWLNSSIDLDLALTDEAGRPQRQGTEGPDDTVRLEFTAGQAGVYCLAVRDGTREGGAACAYRVEVRNVPPQPQVFAEVEGLTVPRGSFQPVPLTVTRDGYNGPLTLTLTGAPPGVALVPNKIPAGVKEIVCKLSAEPNVPLGLHTLQIWAQTSDVLKTSLTLQVRKTSEVLNQPKALVQTRPLVDRQLLNVDLIPYSLREDQRRLPPSVSDRLALQVTVAAPFTVELAENKVTLARYQKANIPLVTTRLDGFAGPISFTARGGQLADKEEGRTRVYAEFPQATPRQLKVSGTVRSLILTNLGRTRIEVLASAEFKGRTITLIRTFDLDIKTAFEVKGETIPVKLASGGRAKVRLTVDRAKSFDGPVIVELTDGGGLLYPEKVTIPRGKTSVEFEVKAEPDAAPGRRGISLSASADVDGFEEEHRAGRIEIDVAKPEAPKKK
jgi:hypothetical protein